MDFSVIVKGKEVVRAALPLQEHRLALSNLDLLLPPLDVGVFFCYKKPPPPQQTGLWMTRVLKRSLAQTLGSFYPLSGEVVRSPTSGEPELLCNNRGVEFVEAYADVELRELDLCNPDTSVGGKLMQKKIKDRVLSVQTTELRCGGVVVACTFDHRVADAFSANMFLVAWAEIARFKPISLQPSFRRSLLHPRSPLTYHATLDDMYAVVSKQPLPTEIDAGHNAVSRIFYLTSEKINTLQAKASSGGCRRTKLESFSAYLWQTVAKTQMGGGGAAKTCKMGVIVDGRMRLCGGGDGLSNYFGNVLSIPFGEETSEELSERPLSWVASAVHGFLSGATTKEHFLGLIDWVEAHRPETAMTRIYSGGKEESGPAFVISSGQRFPVSKVDFGWGRPVFGSYHFPWGGECGYVMPMPSSSRDGDWVVYVEMVREQLELLEKEARDVLHPLTSQYYLYDSDL